jgi:uncharacterized protein (DUF433 family)
MQQFQRLEERDRELVPPSDPRFEVISINPARMSGAPCFKGSRVPVQTLWDHLEGGESIEVFLEDFEGVTREQVLSVLRMAKERLLDGLPQP